jgi:hypothetical protein
MVNDEENWKLIDVVECKQKMSENNNRHASLCNIDYCISIISRLAVLLSCFYFLL